MTETLCAVCETNIADHEVYPDTLTVKAATKERFSARRTPDRVHYRMVRCATCGLLRSNPILSDGELAELYRESSMTYGEEAAFARRTYGEYLSRCLATHVPDLDVGAARLLEIGCGSGFFLDQALEYGFADVTGVEPSREAVDMASNSARERIVNDILRPGLFPPNHFDVVCGFQVFDHLPHPNDALRICYDVLRPGGVALFINHDMGAWTNRLLGSRSPVIDIEHVYLFDMQTMARIFRKNGFQILHAFSVTNSYPIHYWMKMAPIPRMLKEKLVPALKRSGFGQIEMPLRAGNLGLFARKG